MVHEPSPQPAPKRPWKGVIFPCCGVYGRVYQSVLTGRFEGNCPRCGRKALAAMVLLALFLLLSTAWAPPAFAGELHDHSLRDSLVPVAPPSPSLSPDSVERPPTPKPLLDSVRFALFAQTGLHFLGFDDRKRFVLALDSLYTEYLSMAPTRADSAKVKQQKYQTVNFCFPWVGGADFQLFPGQNIALGLGYIYDREAVVLIDHNAVPHEVFYTLQAVPLFVEWRIAISNRLMTLSQAEHFSATLRWFWLMGGTEVQSGMGVLTAAPRLWGNGWSIALGYQIARWKALRLYGDLGYASLQAYGRDSWDRVAPDNDSLSRPEKASWDLGGLQLNLRASWALWNR